MLHQYQYLELVEVVVPVVQEMQDNQVVLALVELDKFHQLVEEQSYMLVVEVVLLLVEILVVKEVLVVEDLELQMVEE